MRETPRLSEIPDVDQAQTYSAEVSPEVIEAAAIKALPFRVLITDSGVLVGREIDEATETSYHDRDWS